MKNLLFLLAVIFMQNTVLAQEKTAKISFKFETIDYGTIAVNSDGIRVFEFTNTGDAPLIITEVLQIHPELASSATSETGMTAG